MILAQKAHNLRWSLIYSHGFEACASATFRMSKWTLLQAFEELELRRLGERIANPFRDLPEFGGADIEAPRLFGMRVVLDPEIQNGRIQIRYGNDYELTSPG